MNGLIYTGGDWPDLATAKMLSERADLSICCDGAAEEAYRYGLPFQTLVGMYCCAAVQKLYGLLLSGWHL